MRKGLFSRNTWGPGRISVAMQLSIFQFNALNYAHLFIKLPEMYTRENDSFWITFSSVRCAEIKKKKNVKFEYLSAT